MSQVLVLQQDARQVPVRDGSVHFHRQSRWMIYPSLREAFWSNRCRILPTK